MVLRSMSVTNLAIKGEKKEEQRNDVVLLAFNDQINHGAGRKDHIEILKTESNLMDQKEKFKLKGPKKRYYRI
jgi:hypothetical protein